MENDQEAAEIFQFFSHIPAANRDTAIRVYEMLQSESVSFFSLSESDPFPLLQLSELAGVTPALAVEVLVYSSTTVQSYNQNVQVFH